MGQVVPQVIEVGPGLLRAHWLRDRCGVGECLITGGDPQPVEDPAVAGVVVESGRVGPGSAGWRSPGAAPQAPAGRDAPGEGRRSQGRCGHQVRSGRTSDHYRRPPRAGPRAVVRPGGPGPDLRGSCPDVRGPGHGDHRPRSPGKGPGRGRRRTAARHQPPPGVVRTRRPARPALLDQAEGTDNQWAARADALHVRLVPPGLDPDPLV